MPRRRRDNLTSAQRTVLQYAKDGKLVQTRGRYFHECDDGLARLQAKTIAVLERKNLIRWESDGTWSARAKVVI